MAYVRKMIIAALLIMGAATLDACKTLRGTGGSGVASPPASASNPNTPPPSGILGSPSGTNLHGQGETSDYAGTDTTGTRSSHADEAGFRGAGSSGREMLP